VGRIDLAASLPLKTNDIQMKKLILLGTALLGLYLPVKAQQDGSSFSTAGWWQASTGKFSPAIDSSGRVTFRVKAPQASKVQVEIGDWDIMRLAMEQDTSGVWTASTSSLLPGIYQYVFVVDGKRSIDLANPKVKYGTEVYGSVLEIIARQPAVDQLRAVNHGELRMLTYTAIKLNKQRNFYAYVPPQAVQSTKPLPVLYLRHGGGDDEGSWFRDGRVAYIMDNLIAEKKIKPMLVVMTNGLTDGSWAGGSSVEGMDLLEDELLNDVKPLVEQRFNVGKDKSSRAIAGLSMGGGQAFVIGMRNKDTFQYIGQFSSGLLSDPAFDFDRYIPNMSALKSSSNSQAVYIWSSCGTKDPRYNGHLAFLQKLKSYGVDYVYDQADAGHEWSFWRGQLEKFVQQIFKEHKK